MSIIFQCLQCGEAACVCIPTPGEGDDTDLPLAFQENALRKLQEWVKNPGEQLRLWSPGPSESPRETARRLYRELGLDIVFRTLETSIRQVRRMRTELSQEARELGEKLRILSSSLEEESQAEQALRALLNGRKV